MMGWDHSCNTVKGRFKLCFCPSLYIQKATNPRLREDATEDRGSPGVYVKPRPVIGPFSNVLANTPIFLYDFIDDIKKWRYCVF